MPATPELLLVACRIVPATCVPWPTRSSTGDPAVKNTKPRPGRNAEPLRSGFIANGTVKSPKPGPVQSRKSYDVVRSVTPLSMTATMTSDEPPGLMSQAAGMLMASKCHCSR